MDRIVNGFQNREISISYAHTLALTFINKIMKMMGIIMLLPVMPVIGGWVGTTHET